MISIHYPESPFKIRGLDGQEEIFDPLRRLWVRLSPEEWVRQNVLQWLIEVQGYPRMLMAVEKELLVGRLRKRFDILLYSADHQPWMLVECKAASVELTEKTLLQVLRYNMTVRASYLLITNGNQCYAADIRSKPAVWMHRMPEFPANP